MAEKYDEWQIALVHELDIKEGQGFRHWCSFERRYVYTYI